MTFVIFVIMEEPVVVNVRTIGIVWHQIQTILKILLLHKESVQIFKQDFALSV